MKLEPVTEAGSTGPEKVALTTVPAATPAAEAAGLLAITFGAPAVVKLHESAPPSGPFSALTTSPHRWVGSISANCLRAL